MQKIALSGSAHVAEFVNTPIPLEDVAIELSDEEAAMLDGLRLLFYGADDGAALHDILFHVVGTEISRRRREPGTGDWGPEDVRRSALGPNSVAWQRRPL